MSDLCREKQVKSFKVVSTYMSNEFSPSDLDKFKTDIERYDLSEEFTGFFDELIFMDSELFGDPAHLKRSVIPLYDNYLD